MEKLLALLLLIPAIAFASPPCGRLTLTAGQPVMTAGDITATAISYANYVCNTIPLYNGSVRSDTAVGELTLALSGSAHIAGNLYDLFAYNNNGTVALASGPAWSSTTARSAAISMFSGIWTNTAPMALRLSGGAATAPANQATYLGTFYATANGQTKFQMKPSPVSYGSANVLGLWNAYNRIPIVAVNRDLNTSWVYANSGLRFADNSSFFHISWVDGLAQSQSHCRYISSVAGSTNGPAAAATVGCGYDQTSYPINWNGFLGQAALNSVEFGMSVEGEDVMPGALGLHLWQAMEQSTTAEILFYGNNFSALTVRLDM
jgi:hypothetical protein